MDFNIDKNILDLMIKLSKKAYKKGEIPVSAVIIDKDNNVVSFGLNRRQKGKNVLGHAEIMAILKAENRNRDWRLDGFSMVVSLEPCDMCSVVIRECRLDNVYYLLPRKGHDCNLNIDINKFEIEGYENYKNEFRNLLTSFFDNKR